MGELNKPPHQYCADTLDLIIKTALKSPATKFVIDPREVIAPSKAMEAYQVKLGSLKEAAPLDDLFDVRFYEKARRPG